MRASRAFGGLPKATPAARGYIDDKKGGVAEWFKATVLKTVVSERVPWVRIPPPPPLEFYQKTRCFCVESISAEMGLSVTRKVVDDLLGPPTDISEIDAARKESLARAAFNLYVEAAILTVAVSHLYESVDSTEVSLTRNQAIEAGLAVRITKYMGAVMALHLDKVRQHGEVVMTLNRCITETAVNLMFFCEKATSEDYDEFVKSSLRPERDLYKTVQENIAKRGKVLPIEVRMLNSITRVFDSSGVSGIDELNRIPKRKDYKTILDALGMSSAYPMMQGVPSHLIHGTWVDIMSHHLEKMISGFRPKPEPVVPDPRLLCPVATLVLCAMRSYVNKNFPVNHPAISLLLDRIGDLMERTARVDALHEEQISK
jgi:hypothetical protein